MAKIVLILLIALLFAIVARLFARASRLSYSPTWHTVLDVSERLSKGNEKVRKAIIYAMRDRAITSELSQFRLVAEDEFQDRLVDWIDEDTLTDDIPAAVFKTVLHGYGYMAYMDWKNIADIEELISCYNNVSKTWRLPKIEGEDAQAIIADFRACHNQSQAVNIAIDALNQFAQESHREILWFDEDGDSYAFFLTTQSNAAALAGQSLDGKHHFLSEFTLTPAAN